MNTLVEILSYIAIKCGQNKYMNAIKNAFQSYMPATIAGAIGMFWTNVLINDQRGLGTVFPPIMILKVFNPIFIAMNFATISCISIGIVILLSGEIADANGDDHFYPVIVSLLCWLIVTPHTITAADMNVQYYVQQGVLKHAAIENYIHIPASLGLRLKDFTVQGIGVNYTSSSGLFTAMFIAILSAEVYHLFRNCDHLLIKLPDQASTSLVLPFMNILPTLFTCLVFGSLSQLCILSTGHYLNTFIYNVIQFPLQLMTGDNLLAVLILYFIISLFWILGFHGKNLMSPIIESFFRPLLYINMTAFNAGMRGNNIPYIFNTSMLQMFGDIGGSGSTLGLVIYILLFSKRHDNRIIANVSLVPGLMNINETVIFGMPLVLNPILDIPFILAPLASITVGFMLIKIGFCPPVVSEVPWVMPPIIYGFLVTGGNLLGALSQFICFFITTLIYVPFIVIYERKQRKEEYIY